MALHGNLQVNSEVIGEWIAVREIGGAHDDDINTYLVTVVEFRPDGNNAIFNGRITHRYGDGAFALAAKILQTAVYG